MKSYIIMKYLKNINILYSFRKYSTVVKPKNNLEICGREYITDNWTNVTPKILSRIGTNLHLKENHPLGLLKSRIINYMYKNYVNSRGNPIFSVYDNLSPIVTTLQNFDSLLIPMDHPSRKKTDCYYINKDTLLRAHTTAHQAELLQSGLNSFLIVGDVYRRDEIDATHYPVFHQLDAVRLYSKQDIFKQQDLKSVKFIVNNFRTENKQETHSEYVSEFLEKELKTCLEGLARSIFGNDAELRWISTTFPFTHPSWELEVLYDNEWLELLGCGIMEQNIINNCGVTERVGWAFGMGLERIAMFLHKIPDIRLFWSNDTGFLSQFSNAKPNSNIIYKPISVYPQCINDLSFWLPNDGNYEINDFYELVRSVGGDIVEQVTLIDNFIHPKTKRQSHCYRIVYRHMEKTLTQEEVNDIHNDIANASIKKFNVEIR